MDTYNFTSYKQLFNKNLENILKKQIDSDSLYGMVMYALNGGKRLRPILSIDICLKIGGKLDDVINFAVAIELIHNSSLIIDDLPCMDNDNYRRNKLSFHRKYSEYKAQIVSNVMVNIALKLIYYNFRNLEQSQLTIIVNSIVKNLGVLGAAGGQLIDLTPIHTENKRECINTIDNKAMIKDLFNKKTASFFEIAFVGGYISGKGSINNLEAIKDASYHFGLAFQIYDDFDDIQQDSLRKNKNLFDPNYINNFGSEEATKEFNNSKDGFIRIMTGLSIYSSTMKELVSILSERIN